MSGIQHIDRGDFYVKRSSFSAPSYEMHHHNTYELYYLVNGQREYFINDRFFLINAGDLVLIPHKVFHRTAGKGGLRYLVHFSLTYLRKFFTDDALAALLDDAPLVFRASEANQPQLLSLLSTIHAEYNKASRDQDDSNEMLMIGTLFQLLFAVRYNENTYQPYHYADARITQIIHYINENYDHINDIEQIAEHFFISKYHLCRYFRKNLGISLISYLNAIKIREACNLIKNGCSNMTQVAFQCGFNSSSYFCKVFKQEKGISPTEYRKTL